MRSASVIGTLKLLAALLLGVCLLLPFYSLPEADGSKAYTHAWDLVDGDWGTAGLVALAFLWPWLPAALRGRAGKGRRHLVALAAEPVLAIFSIVLIVAIRSSAFSIVPLFGPWLMIPVSGSPAIGSTLGLVADGIYLAAWVAGGVGWVVRRRSLARNLTHAAC